MINVKTHRDFSMSKLYAMVMALVLLVGCQSAYYSASNIVDMEFGQRSRNEAKIIHPTFDQMPKDTSQKVHSGDYDVNYSLVQPNSNQEYASQFLKKVGQEAPTDPLTFNRFEDNC